jgi:hypothetical protein
VHHPFAAVLILAQVFIRPQEFKPLEQAITAVRHNRQRRVTHALCAPNGPQDETGDDAVAGHVLLAIRLRTRTLRDYVIR